MYASSGSIEKPYPLWGGAILLETWGPVGMGYATLRFQGRGDCLLLLPFSLELPAAIETGTMTGGKEKPSDRNLFVVPRDAAGKDLFCNN